MHLLVKIEVHIPLVWSLFVMAKKDCCVLNFVFFSITAVSLTLCQKQYIANYRSLQPKREPPRCQEDGSFEKIQCRGMTCFCVDTETGRVVKDTSIITLYGEPRCHGTGKQILYER